jgi:hypothetical protein
MVKKVDVVANLITLKASFFDRINKVFYLIQFNTFLCNVVEIVTVRNLTAKAGVQLQDGPCNF